MTIEMKITSEGCGKIVITDALEESLKKNKYSSEQFRKELESLIDKGAKSLEISINSGGGNVMTSIAIANLIKESGLEATCNIFGLCASAATLIACACGRVTMNKSGHFMIHRPQVGCTGNATDIASALKLLRNVEKNVIKTYCSRTGKSKEEITKMMAEETWMDGQEALTHGFIDALR